MPARIFLALYLAFFAGLLALVLFLNFDETASFTWWPGHRLERVPLVYLVLGGLVVGAVYASVVALFEQARLSLSIRRLKRRLAALEPESVGVPAMPARADPPAEIPSAKAAPESTGGSPTPDPEDERPWSH